MYGALIGDYVGSRFEFNNIKSKDFELFHKDCRYTDDTVMTLAIKSAIDTIINPKDTDLCEDAFLYTGTTSVNIADERRRIIVDAMQYWGKVFPGKGYGGSFSNWLASDDPKPYNSWGNGSAMRVSYVGWVFKTLYQTEKYARMTAEVTHNHPEGIKGAVTTAGCVYLARKKYPKWFIKRYVMSKGYKLRPCDEVRPTYRFDVSCQGTIPVAVEAFLESTDFEDAIRTAISMGGDSDTIGAITGAIAEAYYGMNELFNNKVEEILKDIDIQHKKYLYREQNNILSPIDVSDENTNLDNDVIEGQITIDELFL